MLIPTSCRDATQVRYLVGFSARSRVAGPPQWRPPQELCSRTRPEITQPQHGSPLKQGWMRAHTHTHTTHTHTHTHTRTHAHTLTHGRTHPEPEAQTPNPKTFVSSRESSQAKAEAEAARIRAEASLAGGGGGGGAGKVLRCRAGRASRVQGL